MLWIVRTPEFNFAKSVTASYHDEPPTIFTSVSPRAMSRAPRTILAPARILKMATTKGPARSEMTQSRPPPFVGIPGYRHVSRSRKAANVALTNDTRAQSTLSNTEKASDELLAAHTQAVASIATQIKNFHSQKQPFRISHGSTNSTRPRPTSTPTVSTAALSHVLHVNKESLTALVEPNIPMDRLVEALLPHGLLPPVVMEFPGITVGGGYAGTSGESSSYKHGFFDRNIRSVEMVLGNGEVVRASESERADLFRGAAGAVGSLGTVTAVELQLVEAKPWVDVTYHPVKSVSEAVRACKEVCASSEWDYVDGILFSKTEGAIVTGKMVNELPEGSEKVKFSGAGDPWFYVHVQESAKARKTKWAVPLAEYLFRYDRGGFWVGRSAFHYFHMPFNRLTRWWLDDFCHTRMMYTALHASGHSKRFVVQDLALPYRTVEEFIDYIHDEFNIYPLWLCPLKQSPAPTMHPHSSMPSEPMLNVGLWGDGPWDYKRFVEVNKGLERKLQELDGMKWLYAHTYQSEDEFWKSFDKPWYDSLREKYNATYLPSVYEKVRIDIEKEAKNAASPTGNKLLDMWPISGLYGIKKAIESKTYVASRASSWKGWPKDT